MTDQRRIDGRENWCAVQLDGYCAADLTETTGADHSTAYEIVTAGHLGEILDVLDFPAQIRFIGDTRQMAEEGHPIKALTPGPGFDVTDPCMEGIPVYRINRLFM